MLIPFVASAATAQTLAKAPRSVTTRSARAPRRSDRRRAEARQRHRPRSPARDLAGRLRRIAACAPRSGSCSATRKRDWRVSHDGQEASAIRRIIRFVISDIVECSDIARRSHLADPPFSARFRHIFASFRPRIGRFDPLLDTIFAPGDLFLAGFSMPYRRLVGPKEDGIPSRVANSLLAGLLPSDLLS